MDQPGKLRRLPQERRSELGAEAAAVKTRKGARGGPLHSGLEAGASLIEGAEGEGACGAGDKTNSTQSPGGLGHQSGF